MTVSRTIRSSPTRATSPTGPVCTHNEWDPLEEVVLGRLDGAAAGTPAIAAREVQRDLEALAARLMAHGVTVHRPEPTPHERSFTTPHWEERGFSSACPRDAVLVVGEELIEMPLAWRARYYETDALRSLFLSYFRAGARWVSAPRPELRDELYAPAGGEPIDGSPAALVTTEVEPVLSAADVVRCGRDLFVMRTPGTNASGIAWLRRHLRDGYRVHEIRARRPFAGTLDTVFLPLSPRDVLVRDDAVDVESLPEVLRGCRIRIAPRSGTPAAGLAGNVLLLDPERVLVECSQEAMIEALREWGFEPIAVALPGYAALGGFLRRATLDIRRRGTLESYFA